MGRHDRNMNPQKPQTPKHDSVPPQQLQLTPEIVHMHLYNQQLEAQNEAEKNRIREKEIEANVGYAKEALKFEAERQKRQPSEDRKTILLISGVAIAFVVLLMSFILICIQWDQKELVDSIMKGIGYVITSAVSYWIGKGQGSKTKKSSNDDDTSAEVIND